LCNRIYVQTGVYKEFATKLQVAVSKLKMGDGFDPKTTLGPLIGLDAVKKVNSHIEDAISKGAESIYCGPVKRHMETSLIQLFNRREKKYAGSH